MRAGHYGLLRAKVDRVHFAGSQQQWALQKNLGASSEAQRRSSTRAGGIDVSGPDALRGASLVTERSNAPLLINQAPSSVRFRVKYGLYARMSRPLWLSTCASGPFDTTAGTIAETSGRFAASCYGITGRRTTNWSSDAVLIVGRIGNGRVMVDDDLLRATTRRYDDLLAIAKMFAEAEHYLTALHIQGFARRIVDEAAEVTSTNGGMKDEGHRIGLAYRPLDSRQAS